MVLMETLVRFLMTRITWVKLGEGGSGYSLQHLLGEDTQQLPANVQRFKYCAVLIITLGEKKIV